MTLPRVAWCVRKPNEMTCGAAERVTDEAKRCAEFWQYAVLLIHDPIHKSKDPSCHIAVRLQTQQFIDQNKYIVAHIYVDGNDNYSGHEIYKTNAFSWTEDEKALMEALASDVS